MYCTVLAIDVLSLKARMRELNEMVQRREDINRQILLAGQTGRLSHRGQLSNRSGETPQRLNLWVSSLSLKYKEDVVQELENAPRAFVSLLKEENSSKLLVSVSDS